MKADGVLDLIKDLKNAPIEVQTLGENILDYIYKVVYKDYFDYEREQIAASHEKHTSSYESALRPLRGLKTSISYLLDGKDSIITYFHEMVKDNKKEFIDLFIEKSEPFFELIKNNYYDPGDFKSISFTFNLYTMLSAYHYSKDDLERYKVILDDVDFLIGFSSFYNSHNLFGKKKEVIDILVGTDLYNSVRYIREELVSVLREFPNTYSFDENYPKKIAESLKEISELKEDHDDLQSKYPGCLMLDLNSLCSDIIRSKKYNDNKTSYYHKHFLIGRRYNFMNNDISKYLSADFLVKEFVTRVMKMDFAMFDEESINQDGKIDFDKNDFFMDCMISVLDSDSFEEVNRKLVALNFATELYRDGNRTGALVLIDKIKGDDYKTVTNGKVVGYSSNSLNVTEKPTNIGDRMILAYKKLYPDIENEIAYLMKASLRYTVSYSLSSLFESFDERVKATQQKYIDDAIEKERKALEEQARLELEQNTREEVVEEPVVETVPKMEEKDKAPQKRKSFFKGWS